MAFHGNTLPSALVNGLRRQQQADAAGFGSIAARFAPNQYGSILSRKYPGAFGQEEDGNAPNIAKDNAQIQANDRVLTLRRQQFGLAHPELEQQQYAQHQQNILYQNQQRQAHQQQLGPLDDDEENPFAP